MAIRNTWEWVDGLRPRVPALSATELAERIARGDKLTLVDIRELQERVDSGAIANSHHVPRGMLEFWADPASTYYRDYFTEDAEYVVYCAGGGRSVLAALAMLDMGYTKVSHLDLGFGGWKKAGLPIEDAAATSRWQRKP
ncbi:rhodanese-like domain-containing protein [Aquamicrobium sp. LC103]|uniref:rhodanese-like domain-containing protein n=1 Tax=Aquamicrobium sp. LC103 TaxID=1120658 RepID=UPI00069B2CF9|nr:rhodanese-like domain-containing protein [Aquamicrobium sp. LC103]TKT76349.1 rhodanese-like domain-containing protein [Aquamicrobium sp. LC103]